MCTNQVLYDTNVIAQSQINQNPSNIISGTYINSNIIVHNPIAKGTKSYKKSKVKLSQTTGQIENRVRG